MGTGGIAVCNHFIFGNCGLEKVAEVGERLRIFVSERPNNMVLSKRAVTVWSQQRSLLSRPRYQMN